jgi:hypothetical protein
MKKYVNYKSKSAREPLATTSAAEFDVFSVLAKSTRNLLNNELEEDTTTDLEKSNNNSRGSSDPAHQLYLKRINRGLSARRYLRNLTKNWDQSLLDSFILDGKISEETVYERDDKSLKRKRVDDDLSLKPQAYRFDKTWINATVDMRSYKFLRAQDFDLNRKKSQGQC